MASQAAGAAQPKERWRVLHWSSRQLAYRELLTDGVWLTLLRIPAGSFLMGAPEGEEGSTDRERPVHPVTLREFLLAQTPVTQAQWRAVAQWQRQEREDVELWPMGLNPDPVAGLQDPERFRGDDKPVVNVSWRDAVAFCRRLQLRTGKHYSLPSEAQWEYACRAGTTTPFAFGETLSSELANHTATVTYAKGPKGEFRQQTTPVGMFPANAWGLQDMHGNVWEWCLDDWHANYVGAPEDGSAWLEEKEGEGRLRRGGSWFDHPRYCRSASRDGPLPDGRVSYGGFRVCCLPPGSCLDP
jgi:formylglycine-generating enzyme required for sulfatase activity